MAAGQGADACEERSAVLPNQPSAHGQRRSGKAKAAVERAWAAVVSHSQQVLDACYGRCHIACGGHLRVVDYCAAQLLPVVRHSLIDGEERQRVASRKPFALATEKAPPMGVDCLLPVHDIVHIESRPMAIDDALQRASRMQLVPHGKHSRTVGIVHSPEVPQVQVHEPLTPASRTERQHEEKHKVTHWASLYLTVMWKHPCFTSYLT